MNNNDKKEPSEFAPKPPTPIGEKPPTMQCFIVPVEAMEVIRDAVREAPYKVANPVLQSMRQMQVADVPINKDPPG
jgi:hypothetical protein